MKNREKILDFGCTNGIASSAIFGAQITALLKILHPGIGPESAPEPAQGCPSMVCTNPIRSHVLFRAGFAVCLGKAPDCRLHPAPGCQPNHTKF